MNHRGTHGARIKRSTSAQILERVLLAAKISAGGIHLTSEEFGSPGPSCEERPSTAIQDLDTATLLEHGLNMEGGCG